MAQVHPRPLLPNSGRCVWYIFALVCMSLTVAATVNSALPSVSGHGERRFGVITRHDDERTGTFAGSAVQVAGAEGSLDGRRAAA
jgi:hypothetical protein